ncbi:Reverse transcriptase (RNA-dependent DNA polymerase) [Rosistilla carotiformis]|uniref:Reverse transcriptase (RNA-dependent DNA polymerase) n=1 Tax=Rosistilla carotiformis TaxID=2528017 RepID=A0A518JVU6_9BACT|nr:antiviral reverse transcriptase Drt3a [Rosistilla carotiformis]QDV69662.1 Reverse transcriptase (RNA-dependent DNA polymerase) [Rosistilla carotiformis]
MTRLSDPKYITTLVRADDCLRFIDARHPGPKEAAIQIAARFADRSYVPQPVEATINRGKSTLRVTSYADALFLRHCCRVLRSGDIHHPPSRQVICRQLKSVLESDVPHFIVRTDIAKCFGSMPAEQSLNLPSVRKKLKAVEFKWCKTLLRCNDDPLQRLHYGLAISSDLAEHFLADFDRQVICHPGVVYYSRFVDDILIVTAARSGEHILEKVDCALPTGLSLNRGKTSQCHWNDGIANRTEFEYLGYSFMLTKKVQAKKRTAIEIGLSERKELQIRQRLDRVFLAFQESKDFLLLRDRLRYLTGGTTTHSNFTRRRVQIGLRSSHPELTNLKRLSSLDGYLHQWIRTINSDGTDASLKTEQLRLLRRISFSASYKLNIRHRFSGKRLWLVRDVF